MVMKANDPHSRTVGKICPSKTWQDVVKEDVKSFGPCWDNDTMIESREQCTLAFDNFLNLCQLFAALFCVSCQETVVQRPEPSD